jgi:hypothetical protein
VIERHTLTRDGSPEGEPIGVGFYYRGWRDTPMGCLSKTFPNGMIRRVFVDKDGRSLCVGWFRPNAYSA